MQSESRRIDRQLQRVQSALRLPPPAQGPPLEGAAQSGKKAAKGKGPDTGAELNKVLVEEVMTRVLQTQRVIDGHHARLRWTYATYMVLAVLMFLAGLAMLFMPLMDKGNPETVDLWLSAIGGAEIVALLIFSPFQRIQGLMGDMTQVILIMEGYLHQVALRLLQCRIKDPKSVGSAANFIHVTTKETARLIQDYFENAPGAVTTGLLSRRSGSARAGRTTFEALRERLDGLERDATGALGRVPSDPVGGATATLRTTRRKLDGETGLGGLAPTPRPSP